MNIEIPLLRFDNQYIAGLATTDNKPRVLIACLAGVLRSKSVAEKVYSSKMLRLSTLNMKDGNPNGFSYNDLYYVIETNGFEIATIDIGIICRSIGQNGLHLNERNKRFWDKIPNLITLVGDLEDFHRFK